MSEAVIVPISRSPVAADVNLSRLQDASSAVRSKHGGATLRAREDQVQHRRWKIGFFAFYGALAVLLSALAMVADRPRDAPSRQPVRPALLSHQSGLPGISLDGHHGK